MRRWITDPQTRPEAPKFVSEATKQPVERLASWVYTSKDYFVARDAMVNAERLQQNVNDMHRLGISPAVIDVKPHLDMLLAREAAAGLGGK